MNTKSDFIKEVEQHMQNNYTPPKSKLDKLKSSLNYDFKNISNVAIKDNKLYFTLDKNKIIISSNNIISDKLPRLANWFLLKQLQRNIALYTK